jgi:hypothetical protein
LPPFVKKNRNNYYYRNNKKLFFVFHFQSFRKYRSKKKPKKRIAKLVASESPGNNTNACLGAAGIPLLFACAGGQLHGAGTTTGPNWGCSLA